jgi:urea transport system permease protein
MDWNQITHLPAFWVPLRSFPFAVAAILVLPALLAYVLGTAMFKRRVGGVYFAVITQAVALIVSLGIDGNQGYTGGRNGITDLRTLLGWDIRTTSAQYILYYVAVALLIGCILLGRMVLSTRMGRVLLAMRDREDRLRFSGYNVANFKIFVFSLAAMMSAVGGAMFVLQVGFISPSLVGIVPSIEMVIFAAVGGKMSLLGAVYGTLVVNTAKSLFSESFPQLWLFLMGGLFIAVVMFFPEGLAGFYTTVRRWVIRATKMRRPKESRAVVPAELVNVEGD